MIRRRAAPAGRGGALAGLLAALAVSETGTRLSAIALPWFVLTTTGSPVKTGLVGSARSRRTSCSSSWPARYSTGSGRAGSASAWTRSAPWPRWPSRPARPRLASAVAAARAGGRHRRRPRAGRHGESHHRPRRRADAQLPLERATGLTGTVNRLSITVGPALAGAPIARFGPLTAVASMRPPSPWAAWASGSSTRSSEQSSASRFRVLCWAA
jgi:hypothetical protein